MVESMQGMKDRRHRLDSVIRNASIMVKEIVENSKGSWSPRLKESPKYVEYKKK